MAQQLPGIVNPPEDVSLRQFIPIADVPMMLKEYNHSCYQGSNTGGLCCTHVSIETRSTKGFHSTCTGYYSGSEIKGSRHELLMFRL